MEEGSWVSVCFVESFCGHMGRGSHENKISLVVQATRRRKWKTFAGQRWWLNTSLRVQQTATTAEAPKEQLNKLPPQEAQKEQLSRKA